VCSPDLDECWQSVYGVLYRVQCAVSVRSLDPLALRVGRCGRRNIGGIEIRAIRQHIKTPFSRFLSLYIGAIDSTYKQFPSEKTGRQILMKFSHDVRDMDLSKM